MILVAAVIIGLAAGLCRAWINKRKYRIYDLKYSGLVLLAFIPQFLAFYVPASRDHIPESLVSILLVSSLIILLLFSILNIQKKSFWPISLGFFCNFLVIIFNGGFMPISVETIEKVNPGSSAGWVVGQRYGYSKDVIMTPELIRLPFLSDCLTLPKWMNIPLAFSVGDVLISAGVIWLLWMLGGENQKVNVKE